MTHIFPGQDDSEIVQRVIYKHVFSVLPFVAVAIFLFFVGLFLVYAGAADIFRLPTTDFKSYGTSIEKLPIASIGIGIIGLSIFILLTSLYIWRQNKMVLTSENVVDIDQRGIFNRQIATLRLSRVQDISVSVAGPMQTIFGYGTISIQTAGEKELFVFDYVPEPYAVKAFMVDIFEKFVENIPQEGDGLKVRESDPDRDAKIV